MSTLRVKIVGGFAQPHMIQITDMDSGEQLLDVESFEIKAHVTEGLTCVLHRFAQAEDEKGRKRLIVDPETGGPVRYASPTAIGELDLEVRTEEAE